MWYINATPNKLGNYGNPKGKSFPNSVALSDEFLSNYIGAKGFVLPVIENGQVVSLIINEKALSEYEEANRPDLSVLAKDKVDKLSTACRETIVSGIDITLSDGSVGHFSLEETDQINLTTAFNAIQ